MTDTVRLLDDATRDDLRMFLERLLRIGQPEVRCVTRGNIMGVFGCTQTPESIADLTPVVLVMRGLTLAQAPTEALDRTVGARALVDRLARLQSGELELEFPETVVSAAWAGVLPPEAGWSAVGAIDAPSLEEVAAQGIARVSSALPSNPGEAIVRTVRKEVWGSEIAPGVPAAAAFAAEGMGFLKGEEVARIARTLTWVRLSTANGHVLIRNLLG